MADPIVISSDTPDSSANRMAADFVALVQKAVAERDRCMIALPGGQTPKLFFSGLAQEPLRSQIPWEKVWLFWGDERCVPPDHPESNFKMARELLLDRVGVSNHHVFRMRGEDPPAESARAYAKTLHDVFKTDTEWPTFDLIILGMGADGHTASLMPGTEALNEERRWVVENVVRSLQTVRLTLTLPAINHARHVWFLVSGPKKAAAYKQVQLGPDPQYPASLIEPVSGELRWYVDKAVTS